MGPRHQVDYSDEEGKPIIRRSPRQLARGKRPVYTNGFPKSGRDSPKRPELFQKAATRRPRLFTERRQKKLTEFMRNVNQTDEEYGKLGSPRWIDAVIRFLGEKGRSALCRSDVTYWIQTSSFFTKYVKRARVSKSPAKVAKRRSSQWSCDTFSPSRSSTTSVTDAGSDDDSSEDTQSVEGIDVKPSNVLTRTEAVSATQPLSDAQSQAIVTSEVPVSAFAKIKMEEPCADSSYTDAAPLTLQLALVQSNSDVPSYVTSTLPPLHLPPGQQLPSESAAFPQMNFPSSVEELSQSFTPATMSFQIPLRGSACPDMGQPQETLIQPAESAGWILYLTADGQVVGDPSLIMVNPEGVIQPIPVSHGGNIGLTSSASGQEGSYLSLKTETLDEVMQPDTAAETSIVTQLQPPGASTQELLTYYSDTIMHMIGELRNSGSTTVNTDGCYHAASLLSLCIRNNL